MLLAKNPEGVSEVVNDLDGDLTNFWQVLQHPNLFSHFRQQCEATPFSEAEFKQAAHEGSKLPWDKAHAFFVRCRQSLAGRMQGFASISTSRRRRGMNEQVSAWLTAVEGLPVVHARLKRVLILNRDANDVVSQFDKPDTVIYSDPPYVHETRTSCDCYTHEMTAEQHEQFLDTVLGVEHAFVAVSGYRCDLYDRKLKDWRRVDREVANHASNSKTKRKMVESLWMNK